MSDRPTVGVAADRSEEMPPVEHIDVSVIVVSFNTVEMTRECLESVFEQTTSVSFEVIVVDNASIDGSAEMITEEFPGATLIASAENLGFGRANNLAAETASGRYHLLLNSDTVVLDHAIDRLVRFADDNPAAGIYGGRSVFADGSLNPRCCWGEPTLWSELCLGLGLTALFPNTLLFNPRSLGTWQRDSEREVEIIAGSFLLMAASLWRQLGGFDPRFFMYGEDIDLCMRGRSMGHRCLFTPDAEIIHHGAGSEPVVADKMLRLLKAKAQLYRKHWSPFRAWLGVRFLDLWVLTRSVGHRVVRRFQPGSSAAGDWMSIWDARSSWRAEG
jgi:N-acetylglucosaminyl-diphospho-decaprenol L-rhamnosyltransferase